MTVQPVHDAESNGRFMLILFDEDKDSMSAAPAGKSGDGCDSTIARLATLTTRQGATDPAEVRAGQRAGGLGRSGRPGLHAIRDLRAA